MGLMIWHCKQECEWGVKEEEPSGVVPLPCHGNLVLNNVQSTPLLGSSVGGPTFFIYTSCFQNNGLHPVLLSMAWD